MQMSDLHTIPTADNLFDEVKRCTDYWANGFPAFSSLTSFDIAALRNEICDSIGKLYAPAIVELEERRAVDPNSCAECGCTDDLACDPVCGWEMENGHYTGLCTNCAPNHEQENTRNEPSR
jgi:hypothetical protein